jgi:acetoin utilization protein AcuB
MLIRDWMTSNVITVSAETSMFKAGKLMKEHDIRRLPVIDDNRRVIGIISDRDVKASSPSKATTLEMHEVYYLLSELKIKDIMTPNPVTVEALDTVEKVALLMLEKGFGGLPVVDADRKLVGIITDHDIFKVLVSITGVRAGGVQLAFCLPDKPGTMRPIFDVLREHQASIISVLSSNSEGGENERNVYVRIRHMEEAQEKLLIEVLKKRFSLLYWAREEVYAS